MLPASAYASSSACTTSPFALRCFCASVYQLTYRGEPSTSSSWQVSPAFSSWATISYAIDAPNDTSDSSGAASSHCKPYTGTGSVWASGISAVMTPSMACTANTGRALLPAGAADSIRTRHSFGISSALNFTCVPSPIAFSLAAAVAGEPPAAAPTSPAAAAPPFSKERSLPKVSSRISAALSTKSKLRSSVCLISAPISESMPRSASVAPSDTFLVSFRPRMFAMQPTRLTPPVSVLRFSAITIEASTGEGCCMNRSIVCRQDGMRWGSVPPTTVSLSPRFSSTSPVSPIAPHWMAVAGRPTAWRASQIRSIAELASPFFVPSTFGTHTARKSASVEFSSRPSRSTAARLNTPPTGPCRAASVSSFWAPFSVVTSFVSITTFTPRSVQRRIMSD
uniref:Uncharacterized protein n=1 Tax=Anopheles coluzzii TaxID=1518534 RepID=A0A8W7P976_ANOCL